MPIKFESHELQWNLSLPIFFFFLALKQVCVLNDLIKAVESFIGSFLDNTAFVIGFYRRGPRCQRADQAACSCLTTDDTMDGGRVRAVNLWANRLARCLLCLGLSRISHRWPHGRHSVVAEASSELRRSWRSVCQAFTGSCDLSQSRRDKIKCL